MRPTQPHFNWGHHGVYPNFPNRIDPSDPRQDQIPPPYFLAHPDDLQPERWVLNEPKKSLEPEEEFVDIELKQEESDEDHLSDLLFNLPNQESPFGLKTKRELRYSEDSSQDEDIPPSQSFYEEFDEEIDTNFVFDETKFSHDDLYQGKTDEEIFPIPKYFFRQDISLYRYQRIGIAWWLERESQTKNGMILDEPGIGKTIQSLTVIKKSILEFMEKNGGKKPLPTLVVCPANLIANWESEIEKFFPLDGIIETSRYYGPKRKENFDELQESDIVFTAYSTLSSEVDVKKPEKGQGKGNIYFWKDDSLFKTLEWRRIILDEAHTIRNLQSKTSRAALLLKSDFYWCLTATPIFNKLNDLYQLISFIKLPPFASDLQQWRVLVGRCAKNVRGGAQQLERHLLEVAIRRTKEKNLPLPDVKFHNVFVTLCPVEIEFYFALFEYSRAKVGTIIEVMKNLKEDKKRWGDEEKDIGNLSKMQQHIFVIILRLRQCVVHPELALRPTAIRLGLIEKTKLNRSISRIALSQSQDRNASDSDGALLSFAFLRKVILTLKKRTREMDTVDSEELQCLICYNEANCCFIPCGHCLICMKCWDRVMSNTGDCPKCKKKISKYLSVNEGRIELEKRKKRREEIEAMLAADQSEKIKTGSSEEEESEQSPPVDDFTLTDKDFDNYENSKMRFIIEKMKREVKKGEKVIIVSQWVTALGIMKEVLERKLPKWGVCHLDGGIPPIKRFEVVKIFQEDPKVRVCLLSLTASSEGLNLTAANKVFLLDPWWNDAKQYQVANRAHRIGQELQVDIYSVFASETIEVNISTMQEKKKQIEFLVTQKGDLPFNEMRFLNDVKLMFKLDNIEPEDEISEKRKRLDLAREEENEERKKEEVISDEVDSENESEDDSASEVVMVDKKKNPRKRISDEFNKAALPRKKRRSNEPEIISSEEEDEFKFDDSVSDESLGEELNDDDKDFIVGDDDDDEEKDFKDSYEEFTLDRDYQEIIEVFATPEKRETRQKKKEEKKLESHVVHDVDLSLEDVVEIEDPKKEKSGLIPVSEQVPDEISVTSIEESPDVSVVDDVSESDSSDDHSTATGPSKDVLPRVAKKHKSQEKREKIQEFMKNQENLEALYQFMKDFQKSQEGPKEPKQKKRKTRDESNNVKTKVTQEEPKQNEKKRGDGSNDEEMKIIAPSGCSVDQYQLLQSSGESLVNVEIKERGFILQNNSSVTHIVSGNGKRSFNILKGLLQRKKIVSFDWIEKSIEEGYWVNEKNYKLEQFVSHKKIGKIFGGVSFFVNVDLSSKYTKEDIEELIEMGGGIVGENNVSVVVYGANSFPSDLKNCNYLITTAEFLDSIQNAIFPWK